MKSTAVQGLSPEQILRKDMDIYFSDRFIREHPAWITEFIALSLRHYQPVDAFQRQLAACLAHDTGDRLERLTAPTLIMTGDDDFLVPPQNSRVLQELIPHAELTLFPGLRHCFFMEADREFNRRTVDFLGSG
jgi:pimeloyl-ACP methyl ester carboxylesterase